MIHRYANSRFSEAGSRLRLPENFLLSVIMPVYNEVDTVAEIVNRVCQAGLPCEIVAVDDGSSDGTSEVLQQLAADRKIKLITHTRNAGKGAAVKTGVFASAGSHILIQDADLEYDPDDYWALLSPMFSGEADVVYGSRFLEPPVDGRLSWHRWGNRLITHASNWFTRLQLTDVETCYKLFRREVLQEVIPQIREDGFGIELELTALLARHGYRIAEVPIRYSGRSYAEGKKIGLRDGLRALWCIVRY